MQSDCRQLPSVRPQLAALLLVARPHPLWPAHAAAAAANPSPVSPFHFSQAQFALDQARKAYASASALAALLPREERLSSAGLKGFRLGSPSQCVYVDHGGRQHNVAPQVRVNAGWAGCQVMLQSSPVALGILAIQGWVWLSCCTCCTYPLLAALGCLLPGPSGPSCRNRCFVPFHDRRTWTPATWTLWPCRSTTSWPS